MSENPTGVITESGQVSVSANPTNSEPNVVIVPESRPGGFLDRLGIRREPGLRELVAPGAQPHVGVSNSEVSAQSSPQEKIKYVELA